ncbi:uncharacterized protein LOC111702177 isoform X2 [Eurytemora carolleeae]|uniref:uncharacterized protein LOC111702177 isoform X2 n=1 Tax=Eurytemora carolleeae TaxID=1294199 RepID=UPI000C75896C|nr:uncharacterized protein LOC111702177 isoform X2 [Eurytemora carolleeae]|eukprot:XP_023329552.1 uncharacterized protein LOC111702177 isoform X2 [Eurytemora affinis]
MGLKVGVLCLLLNGFVLSETDPPAGRFLFSAPVATVIPSDSCGSTLSSKTGTFSTPADFSTQSTCVFKIGKQNKNICQYRLDFDTFLLASPTSVSAAGLGRCSAEQLSLVSGDGLAAPTICGDASGQHMYLNAGGETDTAVLTFTGPFTSTSDFSIKVTQIECSSKDRAPDGCLQYFTEETGSIESFNFDGSHLLENMDYKICIKNGKGMCGARYTEDPNIAESFLMSTEEWAVESFTDAAAGGVGGAGPLQGDFCDNYITILGGFTASSLTQESSGYVTTEAAITTTTEAATTTTEAATTTTEAATTTEAVTTTVASAVTTTAASAVTTTASASTPVTVAGRRRRRNVETTSDELFETTKPGKKQTKKNLKTERKNRKNVRKSNKKNRRISKKTKKGRKSPKNKNAAKLSRKHAAKHEKKHATEHKGKHAAKQGQKRANKHKGKKNSAQLRKKHAAKQGKKQAAKQGKKNTAQLRKKNTAHLRKKHASKQGKKHDAKLRQKHASKKNSPVKRRKNNLRNGPDSPVDTSEYSFVFPVYGPQDRYCGYHLNGRSQDLSSTALLPSFNAGNIKETVISENLPLEVLVITTNADEEAAKHPNMAKNPTGFKIRYTQTPCNSG